MASARKMRPDWPADRATPAKPAVSWILCCVLGYVIVVAYGTGEPPRQRRGLFDSGAIPRLRRGPSWFHPQIDEPVQ